MRAASLLLAAALIAPAASRGEGKAGPHPRYKPSSRSKAAMDILTDAYGHASLAPKALSLGDKAPSFTLPTARGGEFSLDEARTDGPVALIFYRGHW